jgi:hypothetical protein
LQCPHHPEFPGAHRSASHGASSWCVCVRQERRRCPGPGSRQSVVSEASQCDDGVCRPCDTHAVKAIGPSHAGRDWTTCAFRASTSAAVMVPARARRRRPWNSGSSRCLICSSRTITSVKRCQTSCPRAARGVLGVCHRG